MRRSLALVVALSCAPACNNPVRAPQQPATSVAEGDWVRVRLDGWFEAVFPMRVEEKILEPSQAGTPFEMREFSSTTNAGYVAISVGESDDGWDLPKEEVLRQVVEGAADGAVVSGGTYGHQKGYVGAQFSIEIPAGSPDNPSPTPLACRVRAFVDDSRLLLGTFCGRPETVTSSQFTAMISSFNPL